MQVSDYKDKIINVLSALFPNTKIILYGSRARGTEREFSDIDIALDAGHKLPRKDVNEAISMFSQGNIPYKIDIVDLNSVSKEMQTEIKREGIVWKN